MQELDNGQKINFHIKNKVKVSDSDYDVKKLANERPVYTVIDQL